MVIEPFDCSATKTLNGSCILGVVVGDSLNRRLSRIPVATGSDPREFSNHEFETFC